MEKRKEAKQQTIISKYTTQKTDIETGRGLNSGYPGG
jgi:hypothetical protein